MTSEHPTTAWFESHGVRFGLRCGGSVPLDSFLACLPPGSVPVSLGGEGQCYTIRASADGFSLTRGAELLLTGADSGALYRRLESDLHWQIACASPHYLFVHAGVVGRQGGAILLPGRTHAGKSTLVAALVRAGALYYSDEYALIDEEGLVHPYPKRLSLRGCGCGPSSRPTAEELGGDTGTGTFPLRDVIFATYRPGAVWNPTPLTPSQLLLGLLDNTILAREPDRALPVLSRAAEGAVGWKGERGEAGEVAIKVLGE